EVAGVRDRRSFFLVLGDTDADDVEALRLVLGNATVEESEPARPHVRETGDTLPQHRLLGDFNDVHGDVRLRRQRSMEKHVARWLALGEAQLPRCGSCFHMYHRDRG